MLDCYICRFCGSPRKNSNSLINHERLCKCNPNRQEHPRGFSGKTDRLKGVSYKKRLELGYITEDAYNSRIAGASKGGLNSPGVGATVELELRRKDRISATMRENPKCGGYRKGSGVGKQGWYKGVWCDSSWELAFVIYHLDHNFPFKRNSEKFAYRHLGKQHWYTPDFKYPDSTYVEVKGYMTAVVESKSSQFPHTLLVLEGRDMQNMLYYCKRNYGNFIDLYEK